MGCEGRCFSYQGPEDPGDGENGELLVPNGFPDEWDYVAAVEDGAPWPPGWPVELTEDEADELEVEVVSQTVDDGDQVLTLNLIQPSPGIPTVHPNPCNVFTVLALTGQVSYNGGSPASYILIDAGNSRVITLHPAANSHKMCLRFCTHSCYNLGSPTCKTYCFCFRNEVWTIGCFGNPEGGSILVDIVLGPQSVVAVPVPGTAAEVQAAFEAHPGIGVGNVSVTGGPLPSTSVAVEFTGALSYKAIQIAGEVRDNLEGTDRDRGYLFRWSPGYPL